jgi:hypothetical protein
VLNLSFSHGYLTGPRPELLATRCLGPDGQFIGPRHSGVLGTINGHPTWYHCIHHPQWRQYLRDALGYSFAAGAQGIRTRTPYSRVFTKTVASAVFLISVSGTEFGPLEFKAVRHQLHGNDRSRQYINKLMRRVRALFRWGASESLVPVSIEQILTTIKPLRPGETSAREALRVFPVSEKAIEAS